MKKKFLAVVMALCVSCVPAVAYAEDAETETGEITAESLLAGTDAEEPTSMSGDVSMNLDAGLDVAMDGVSSSVDVAMTGDFTVQAVESPVQLALSGTYEMSLLGETQEIGMEMYLVMADDYSTTDIYVKTDDGSSESEWQHAQATEEEMKESLELDDSADLGEFFTGGNALTEGLDIDWTLEDTDDAYLVSASAALTDLLSGNEETITDALTASGLSEDVQETVMDCLSGIVLKMSYTYDKEELLPTAFHMDLNDSDLSALNDYIASTLATDTTDSEDETESQTSYTVTLNDFSVDMAITYNDVTEIQVPADALATPAESASDASSEISLDLSGADESETEAAS